MGLVAADRLETVYSNLKEAYFASGRPILIISNVDVDAVCALRIIVSLFKNDYVSYKVVPVSGYTSLSEANERFLEGSGNISSIIMINAGGMIDISEFLTLSNDMRVYVIDSHRPFNLTNIFGTHQVSVLDDGSLSLLKPLQAAYKALEFEDLDESDSESSDEEDLSDDDASEGRPDMDTDIARQRKMKKREYQGMIADYYSGGTYSGMSATSVVYAMASQLGRTSEPFLWYCIVALTDGYLNNTVSEHDYLVRLGDYRTEASLFSRGQGSMVQDSMNDPLLSNANNSNPKGDAGDYGIEFEEDLRLTLFRHWNLYESMFHTSAIATSLGLWRQKGRQKLTNLLLKMGLPQKESLQYYNEMSIQYKKSLREKLSSVGPRYNLPEVLFPSFIKKFGFSSKFSASDIVYSLNALLDAGDSWIRNNGTSHYESTLSLTHTAQRFSSISGEEGPSQFSIAYTETGFVGAGVGTLTPSGLVSAHVTPLIDPTGETGHNRNFFLAFDAVDDPQLLNHGILLAIHFQQVLVRTGMSLIEKKSVRTLRYFQMVILSNAANVSSGINESDFKLFSQSRIHLYRLGKFLMSAFMEFKQKKLPIVLVAWNEDTQTYAVMGIPPHSRSGDIKKNPFGLAFLSAAQKTGLDIGHDSFDSFVVNVQKDDLTGFLESLSLTSV